MSEVRIRPYQPGDEVGIAEAHGRSIREICSRDYPPEAIKIWAAPTTNPQRYLETMERNGERFWVIDDSGTIGGFAGWYGEGIQGFYLHPAFTGHGLARRLFTAIEHEFWQLSPTETCTIQSTLTAQPFYAKMGFEFVAPSTHQFKNSNITIPIALMKKSRPR